MIKVLGVLMWKHYLVRKRRFMVTTLELLAPTIIFSLLFIAKEYLWKPEEHTKPSIREPEHIVTKAFSIDHLIYPALVLYLPNTRLTNLLMAEVGRRLHLNKLNTLPTPNSIGYYALSIKNSSAIAVTELINSMRVSDAVVIFQDMSENMWPSKLNYTIRMKIDYMTHVYKSLDIEDKDKPHHAFGAVYTPFLRLQWAIDSSFLQLFTGRNVNQTLMLQEFPFDDKEDKALVMLAYTAGYWICILSLKLPYVFLMSRLIQDRASGVQELVKMAGVSNGTLVLSHILNVAPSGVLYCISGTLFFKLPPSPLLPLTHVIFIVVALALHFCTIIALAFVCSHVTSKAQYGVTMGTLTYVASMIPISYIAAADLPDWSIKLLGNLPHVPMVWFFLEICTAELSDETMTAETMLKTHGEHSVPVFHCYIYMTVQTILYFALSGIFSDLFPGPFGVAKPMKAIFHLQPKEVPLKEEDEAFKQERDPQYFEPTPENAVAGIQVINVSKVYGTTQVLSHVTFDVLNGEIMILLGHNGAGKTTLMSIMTGMTSASEGKVLVKGKNIETHAAEVRKEMGLCPQHNLFFPHLTVLEHTIVFALLRGQSMARARKSSLELLGQLDLQRKANDQSNDLSGGMKRRLQLACALAGNAKVLILDEPTSGLDVETRRELWDLLLSLRGTRTVLLTTHFMEEADALGDRIAALHGGILRCHATPMFLQKSIGTGYRLSLTTIDTPNEKAITSLIQSIVSGATVREKTNNAISYNLPTAASNKFPKLFSKLEEKRNELKIDSIGVGMSTLEEVFLKLCSDFDPNYVGEDVETQTEDPTGVVLTGVPLRFHQLWILMRRQLKYIWHRKYYFIIINFIIPIGLVLFVSLLLKQPDNPKTKLNNRLVAMNLDVYQDMPERRVLYKIGNTRHLKAVNKRFKTVQFRKTSDVAGAVLQAGHNHIKEYNKYLVGVEINDTTAKVLYTTTVRHAAPVALNLLSNILADQYIPLSDGKTIVTNNYPLQSTHFTLDIERLTDPVGPTFSVMWITCIISILISTLTNTLTLPVKERLQSTRHIHIMMGCPPCLHWTATLLTTTLVFTISFILPTLLIVALLNTQRTFDRADFLVMLFVSLLLTMLAYLAFGYLCSFYLGERGTDVITLLLGIIGMLPGVILTIVELLEMNLKPFWKFIFQLSSFLLPTHQAMGAMIRSVQVARVNAYCTLNQPKCPGLVLKKDLVGFDLHKCCVLKESPLSYMSMSLYSPLRNHVALLLQLIIYMILVVLTQVGVFQRLYESITNSAYSAPSKKWPPSATLLAEKHYVADRIKDPVANCDALLVHAIEKNFVQCFNSFNPVKGISFRVRKGECFGLLGVNGAGKSTTFKMITGEICTTRGRLWADEHYLEKNRDKYLHSMGYCPQFFGLDEFLTGRENLTLLLTLRGHKSRDIANEVDAWIDTIGLEKHKDKIVAGYSGGCQRRLAAAGALAGGSAVALLDEPTTGVDVAARRRVWAAMRRGLNRGRAIIITSHSMDEMEALCDRIAIMANGELAALGTSAELRADYAMGHAVVFMLKAPTSRADMQKAQNLMTKMHKKFNCTLKDRHETMLHYHIHTTMRYSALFTALEDIKKEFSDIIEDYSVTETTLEEVFLSFAHPRRRK